MNQSLFFLLLIMVSGLWSMEIGTDKIIVIPFSSDTNQLFITCYKTTLYDESLKNKELLSALEFAQAEVEEIAFFDSIKRYERCKKFNDATYYFLPELQAATCMREHQMKIFSRIGSVKIPLKQILLFFEQQSDSKIDTYSVNNKQYFISEQLSAILKTKQYNYWDQWLTGRIHHAFFLPFIKQGNETYFYLRVNVSGIYRKDVGIQLDLARIDIDEGTDNNTIAWARLKSKFEEKYHGGHYQPSPFSIATHIPKEGPSYIDYEGDRLYIVEMSTFNGSLCMMAPFPQKEFFDGIQGEGAFYGEYGVRGFFPRKIHKTLLPLLKVFCANKKMLKACGIYFTEKKDKKNPEQVKKHILFYEQDNGDIILILKPKKYISNNESKENAMWYDICSQSKLKSLAIINEEQFEVAEEENCFIRLTEEQVNRLLGFGFEMVYLNKTIEAIKNKEDHFDFVTVKIMEEAKTLQGNTYEYCQDQKIIGKFLVNNLQELIKQNFDFNNFKNKQAEEQVPLNQIMIQDNQQLLSESSKDDQQLLFEPSEEDILTTQQKPSNNNFLSPKNIFLMGIIISIVLISYGCWKYKTLKSMPLYY